MYFTVGCAVEGAHGRKETRFQSMSNLPSHLGNLVKLSSIQGQSWQLPLYHQCPPLYHQYPSSVGTLFNIQPVAQDGSKWKEKGDFLDFPRQQWICVSYNPFFSGEMEIFLSSSDNPTSEEKQHESVYGRLLSCH